MALYIDSSDTKFLVDLIDWLAHYNVKRDSTTILDMSSLSSVNLLLEKVFDQVWDKALYKSPSEMANRFDGWIYDVAYRYFADKKNKIINQICDKVVEGNPNLELGTVTSNHKIVCHFWDNEKEESGPVYSEDILNGNTKLA